MLPRKSAPTLPNSSCAVIQGSPDSGAGTRGGSGASGEFRSARSFARHAMKYPGCSRRQSDWVSRRLALWQSSRPQTLCRSPTRASGTNNLRHLLQGRFRGDEAIHHRRTSPLDPVDYFWRAGPAYFSRAPQHKSGGDPPSAGRSPPRYGRRRSRRRRRRRGLRRVRRGPLGPRRRAGVRPLPA